MIWRAALARPDEGVRGYVFRLGAALTIRRDLLLAEKSRAKCSNLSKPP